MTEWITHECAKCGHVGLIDVSEYLRRERRELLLSFHDMRQMIEHLTQERVTLRQIVQDYYLADNRSEEAIERAMAVLEQKP